MTAKPSALGGIRQELGVEAPPEPHWSERADTATRLQNRSITAQVCVKAAVKLAKNFNAPTPEAALEFTCKAVRRLMAEADRYIRSDSKKTRRAKKKEPAQ